MEPQDCCYVLDVTTYALHCNYMDVGVRELKKHLSELVERAAKGELIRVTDRGEPKALLGPLPGRGRLDRGLEEGWIHRGVSRPPAPARRVHAARRTEELLAEDRDE